MPDGINRQWESDQEFQSMADVIVAVGREAVGRAIMENQAKQNEIMGLWFKQKFGSNVGDAIDRYCFDSQDEVNTIAVKIGYALALTADHFQSFDDWVGKALLMSGMAASGKVVGWMDYELDARKDDAE